MTPSETVAARVDFVVTGEVFCDLVFTGVAIPDPGTETFAASYAFSPGGSVNRATASARLGRRTALLSTIGDDPLGTAVLAAMDGEPHLDLSLLARRPGWQTPVSVAISGAADRSFITYYTPTTPAPFPAVAPPVGVLDIGVDSPLPAWALDLRAAGTLLYAGAGWDASGVWDRHNLTRLADVDAFVLNSVEARSYARVDDPRAAARALGEHVGLVVVTCGPDGVVAYRRETDELVAVPGVTVPAADPTGAGDTFVAAFAASYDLDWPLADRLRLANLAAALSVRGLGGAASAPTAADIVRFSLEHPEALPAPDDPGWHRVRDHLTTITTTPQEDHR